VVVDSSAVEDAAGGRCADLLGDARDCWGID
jgi:hypothetical protein